MSVTLRLGGVLRWGSLAVGSLFVFGLLLLVGGANPLETYLAMARNTLLDPRGASEVLLRGAPLVLTAVATAVPARARLFNVGGEGQVLLGALFAAVAGTVIVKGIPPLVFPLVLTLTGAVGGAIWASSAAFLRVKLQVNEAISTLLLNYVAFLVVGYFVHGPLKDPASFNWPFSPPLADAARYPFILGSRLHVGVLIAPVTAFALWYLTSKTYWGFRARVVGGNPEAARRAGINVQAVLFTSMVMGGAVAGLAGALEVVGLEGRLRPTTGMGLGYAGLLAAWLAGQHPLWILASSLLLAAIIVAGDTLQIFGGLPSSSVNVLMGLVLINVLGRLWGTRR